MAENSKIEWTHHTFNPWDGCTRIGPGCDHCYAETRNNRFHGGNWGVGAPRRRTSAANWKLPLKWNREAAKTGERPRVFCASLADVFDNEVDPQWRLDLFELIGATPNLDWLLLTKRIGNVSAMMHEVSKSVLICRYPTSGSWKFPDNVWLGITVVNQAEADRDIPKLLSVYAKIRWLSMEPLLGSVHLDHESMQFCNECSRLGREGNTCEHCGGTSLRERSFLDCLDWVVAGGESGPGARPMHPDWARGLRNQCSAAGVPFLFKQWGEWVPAEAEGDNLRVSGDCDFVTKEWHRFEDGQQMARIGKKAAGRTLDGELHDGYPVCN